jgi:hypothetical protein
VPEGHCCKICPIPDLSFGECFDESGLVRKNNESWKPIFNGIETPCITCSCKNSSISCNKDTCPPVPPCKPGEQEGYTLCCPKCSSKSLCYANYISMQLYHNQHSYNDEVLSHVCLHHNPYKFQYVFSLRKCNTK